MQLRFIDFCLNVLLSESRDCFGKQIVSPFWVSGIITWAIGLSLEYVQSEQPRTVELTLYCPDSYYLYPHLPV